MTDMRDAQRSYEANLNISAPRAEIQRRSTSSRPEQEP